MSQSMISEADLHGWADDRLDPQRRGEIEALLAERPELAEQLAGWREQNALLHRSFDAVLDEPVPARLLDAARPQPRVWRLAAAFAWLALGGVIGFLVRGAWAPPAGSHMVSLPRQAAIAHVVYTPEVRHPVEVTADQESHLVAWLSKRLGGDVKAPHLAAAGFDLVGGRLLPGEQGPVAQFMYQDGRGQRLTLYVRSDAGENTETAFRYAQEGKVSVFYWLDGRFGYALSGEIGKEELLNVANAVYRQLNP